jgi:hypothetical protein
MVLTELIRANRFHDAEALLEEALALTDEQEVRLRAFCQPYMGMIAGRDEAPIFREHWDRGDIVGSNPR